MGLCYDTMHVLKIEVNIEKHLMNKNHPPLYCSHGATTAGYLGPVNAWV